MSDRQAFRASTCWGCRFCGAGENSKARCLHPKAATLEFKTQLATNAHANTERFSFPDAFDPLAIDACSSFDRPGSRA